MRKNIVTLASVLTIAGASMGATALAHAASTGTANQNIAKTQRINRRHIRLRARLNQAVRDGTITTGQKTAFLDELKILREQRKSDGITKSSTVVERQAERTKLQQELQAWASSHDFPLSKLLPYKSHAMSP